MPNEIAAQPSYLRRDLTTLAVLVVIIAAVVAILWYTEERSGGFSRAANFLLDGLR